MAQEIVKINTDEERAAARKLQREHREKLWHERRAQRRKEQAVTMAAMAAATAVENGKAQPVFRFNKDRLFALGMAIMDSMAQGAPAVTRIDRDIFRLTDYTCELAGRNTYDKAVFYLNPLTGEIGVELTGSGGLGGHQWYVMSMERVGSVTQQMSGYRGPYITELLEEMMVKA